MPSSAQRPDSNGDRPGPAPAPRPLPPRAEAAAERSRRLPGRRPAPPPEPRAAGSRDGRSLRARAAASRPDPLPLSDEPLLEAVRHDLAEHGLTRGDQPDPEDRHRELDRGGQPDPLAPDPGQKAGRQRLRTNNGGHGDRRRIQGSSATTPSGLAGLTSLLKTRDPLPPGRHLSEATVARLGATLLWVLVILAAYGGVSAWLGPSSSASADPPMADPADELDGRWAAAGFAERYVGAYLAAGSDGASLVPFLGYAPNLPTGAEPAAADEPLRTVEVLRGHTERTDYWSVTVAVGEPSPLTLDDATDGTAADDTSTNGDGDGDGTDEDARPTAELFWQVAVDTSGSQPVAAGLPALVPRPAPPDRADLALSLRRPSSQDPMVDSVEGFLAAYLCGGADLDRYVHPDYAVPSAASSPQDSRDDLFPADPPLCQAVEVDRWADAPALVTSDSTTSEEEEEEERRTVVAEVTYDTGGNARPGTHALTLAQRDGRWEVAALLPAPPIEER